MSVTSDLLFAYLREIFYAKPGAKLDIEKIDEDYVMFARGLMFLELCFSQYNDFANALAKGDLSVSPPPPENELASPLKSLHASLKHLTWQSQQVAKGDYKQRVDFMGEFADSFNQMVEQLDDRQRKLEEEITLSRKHADALAQSNLLLSSLTQHIPHQIFVVDVQSRDVLLANDSAEQEIENDPEYLGKLFDVLPDCGSLKGSRSVNIQLNKEGRERYLAINAYLIEWNEITAVALVVNDVSEERLQIKALEDQAYRDFLTHVFNRFYGMLALDEFLELKISFALIFIDMDNLKYVNDVHGHTEGDEYIIRVSRHLQACSPETIVCRLGGDEFMLLAPDMDEAGAASRMADISFAIEHDEYVLDKDYDYSISIGVIAVDEHNTMLSSEILGLADERMYEHKRARKKERKKAGQKRNNGNKRGSE